MFDVLLDLDECCQKVESLRELVPGLDCNL